MKPEDPHTISRQLFPVPRQIESLPEPHAISDGRIVAADIDQPIIYRAALTVQAALASSGHPLEVAGHQGVGQKPAVELVVDPGIAQPQGYRIEITTDRIALTGHDTAGLTYAASSFAQLCQAVGHAPALPCLTITDWPDFERRGIMLDISRDKVPTMESLYRLVDQCAAWKLNELQLYTEHTFAFADHQLVWEDASPMTPGEIITLDAYCRERGIELVPNMNTFGHLARWLKHEAYVHLAECPDPTEVFAWKHHMTVSRIGLNPEDPRSIQLMEDLITELLPNFSSRTLNIGCDETIELGYGRSKQACEERGKGRVYLDFLLKLHQVAADRGRRIQFWGDIIINYPELIPELPKDITALVWGYEHDHPFDKECAAFKASGLDFYVCPGTSSWNTILGRHGNATANLVSAAANGLKHGAKGYLITDWGDGGHWQPLGVSYPYFAYGAALSWGLAANREVDLAGHLDRQVHQDAEGRIGAALLRLGQAAELSGIAPHNSTIFDPILRQAGTRMAEHDVLAKLDADMLERIDAALEQELAAVAAARPACWDGEQIQAEIDLAGCFARHACRQARAKLDTPNGDIKELPAPLRTELRDELGALIARYRELWVVRNRPGGLSDSAKRLEKILAAY